MKEANRSNVSKPVKPPYKKVLTKLPKPSIASQGTPFGPVPNKIAAKADTTTEAFEKE